MLLAHLWRVEASNCANAPITFRRNLYLNRDQMPLFDTQRWTANIEKGFTAARTRWVDGSEKGDNKSGCTMMIPLWFAPECNTYTFEHVSFVHWPVLCYGTKITELKVVPYPLFF